MSIYEPEKKYPCHRCGGLGTIATPDGKHNETCPICGGSGEGIEHEPSITDGSHIKWH